MSLFAEISQKLAAAEQARQELCRARHEANVRISTAAAEVSALVEEIAALRKKKEETDAEREELMASIQQMKICLAALAPKPAPVSVPPRVWRVSDCHSHYPCGSWAAEATESGTYGVAVSPSFNAGYNTMISLFNGERSSVSKKRYTDMKDIRVGDTLYMGDKKRNLVFKGVVKSQCLDGLFRSADSSVASLRRRVAERAAAAGKKAYDVRPLEDEVEANWEVEWAPIGPLTEEWKKYLSFSKRCTVLPLTSAPPA